jgi:poly-gamma-glutamate capsule biosynthesis protein CapA/YwtB (metallophosphatase superfamily)
MGEQGQEAGGRREGPDRPTAGPRRPSGLAVGLALVAVAALLGAAVAIGPARGTPAGSGGTGPAGTGGASPTAVAGLASPPPNGSTVADPLATPAGSIAAAPAASPGASPAGSPAAPEGPDGPAGPGAATVPLAVVSTFDNYAVTTITRATLAARLAAGTLVVPCGAEVAIAAALGKPGSAAPACVPADQVTAAMGPGNTQLALVPPALVTPRVKAVTLEGADLFGEKPARSVPYPLVIATPAAWPAAWSRWTATDVRVIVTTGVNCPDRGVSRQTNVLGRGWDWLAAGGTARYTGTHWDPRFGWTVVDAVRAGNAGAVRNLIRNADVAVSDFECAMTRNFVQHDSGTVFSIDPRAATAMAKAGFDVATVAADHTTNAGLGPVDETVDLFRAAGIQPTGAGRTLGQALRPAVVNAGGITFGFVGFDAIGGSAYATASSAGVAALTPANVAKAVAIARAQGAQVVIALPQWSSVEYRATFTAFQLGVVKTLVAAGVDHVVGADFHWAGALSITKAGSTYRYVGSSQGNFWFDQDWSRQTEEGIITSLTFVGTRLAQVRLSPIVVLDHGQPNLLDPATDGQFVLRQVLSGTTLPSR